MSGMPAAAPLEARLQKIQDLPTLPVTVQAALSLLGDPQSNLREVGELLGTDPVLTARTLRTVNSPYYGLRRRLTNMSESVVYLGRGGTRSLILGSALVQSVAGIGAPVSPAFWEHSFATGILSRALATKLCPQALEEAYLSGLLHDFGGLILKVHFAAECAEASRIAAGGALSRVDAESAVLGGSHADVGAWIGDQWHLPAPVLEGVAAHHFAESAGQGASSGPLCAVVQLADELAFEAGFEGGEEFDGTHSGLARGCAELACHELPGWEPDAVRALAEAEAPDVRALVRMVYER